MVSSFSNWMELVSIATLATKRRNASGRRGAYEHGQVRLRRRAEVVERLQVAEARLRDERPPVVAHPADRLGDPGRVAREQLVVLGRAQEAHDPQLDHEVVDDLLRLGLGEDTRREVALEVDVEERRGAPERHGGAVLLLHRGEVAEVEPLHGLPGARGRARDVEAVGLRHLHELLEGPDLLRELLPVADDVVRRHRGVERAPFLLLPLEEPRDPVERHPPVVADDAAAAVGVRQPGQDVRAAALADVGGVGVEDALVVGLPVLREGLDHVGVGLVAVGLERTEDHAEAAVRHDGALERGLGLQADHDLVLPVDVPGTVGGDRARHLRDVEDALLALLHEQRLELRPDRPRAGGRRGEEGAVALVRLVVLLDEVPDVDLLLPEAPAEPVPGRARRAGRRLLRRGGHHTLPARRAAGPVSFRTRVSTSASPTP